MLYWGSLRCSGPFGLPISAGEVKSKSESLALFPRRAPLFSLRFGVIFRAGLGLKMEIFGQKPQNLE
jgi:hypothetical protein